MSIDAWATTKILNTIAKEQALSPKQTASAVNPFTGKSYSTVNGASWKGGSKGDWIGGGKTSTGATPITAYERAKQIASTVNPSTGYQVSDTQRQYLNQVNEDNKNAMTGPTVFTKADVGSAGFHNQDVLGVRNFNQAYLKNGNPDYLRGTSELQLPGERQALEIPNAVMQMMNATQAWNQGRADVMADTFGKAGDGEYSSRAGLQDYLKKVAPNFAGSGSFNASNRNAANAATINSQREALLKAGGGVLTENRTVGGQVTGGTAGQMANLDKAMAGLSREGTGNGRLDAAAAADKAQAAAEVWKRMQQMKATTSNLPISERVIR